MATHTRKKLPLLASPLLLVLSPGCNNQNQLTYDSLNAEIATLEETVAAASEASQRSLSEHSRRLADAVSRHEDLKRQITETERSVQAVEAHIKATTTEFDAFRDRYNQWIRSNAEGQKIASLPSPDGPSIRDATVTSLDEINIAVSYPGGVKSISLASLPPDLQSRFGFDPDTALRTTQERQRAAAAAAAAAVTTGIGNDRIKQQRRDAELKMLEARHVELIDQREKIKTAIKNTRNHIHAFQTHEHKVMGGRLANWRSEMKKQQARLGIFRKQLVAIENELSQNNVEQQGLIWLE